MEPVETRAVLTVAGGDAELQRLVELARQHGLGVDFAPHEAAETCGFRVPADAGDDIFTLLWEIVDQSPFSLWISDATGTNIYQNAACRRLFGITRDDQTLGKYNLFNDPVLRDSGHLDEIRAVFSHGTTARFTLDYDFSKVPEVNVPGATRRMLDVAIFPIRDREGRVSNAAVQHRDVTAHRLLEEALRRSQKRLRTYFEEAHDLIFTLSPAGRITSVNRAVVNRLGYAPEELIGRSPLELVEPGQRERLTRVLARVLNGESIPQIELEVRARDGSRVWLEVRGMFVRSESGLEETFHIARDITERRIAEDALKFTQFAVDRSRLGVFWVRADASLVYANHEARHYLGLDDHEVVGLSYLGIDVDLTPETWAEHWERLKRLGSMFYESRHRRASGENFPVEVVANFLSFHDQEYACLFARNITERKRANDALLHRLAIEAMVAGLSARFISLSPDHVDREIERSLSALVESLGVDRSYIFLLSPDRRLMSNTHEACAPGIEPQIAQLQDLPVETFPWWMEKLARLETIHIPRVHELPAEAARERAILEKQEIRSVVAAPLVEKGEMVGFLGFDAVRTETTWPEEDLALLKVVGEIFAGALARKHAEEALRESEAKHRTLADNSPDVITRFDPELRFLYISPSIERYTGLPPESFVGRTIGQIEVPESLRELWQSRIREVFRTASPCESQFEYVGPRGPVDFDWKLIPERDPGGRVATVLSVARDVTERKRLEAQLLHAQKMEAIGQLAGGIAHDFNNLLTGILGYANLLKLDAQPDTPVHEAAKTIEKAGERAAELTRQLLGFARRGKYMSVPVNLHDVIREVIGLLGRTLDKNIAIIQRLRAELSLVQGDPGQIQQAILNLAVNARDAMLEGGELSFETDRVVLDEDFCRRYLGVDPGAYLVVLVGDTGHGIPREIQERIFEPFFTTKEQGKGTGMGLAMVYGIVRNHGGAIRVYSEVGKGSVFKVYLPLVDQPAPAEPEACGERPSRGSGRVLLVDDDEVVRSVGAGMLRSLGYEVATAPGGREAVDYYSRHGAQVDLVILDLVMPQMGGRDCFRALRQINPQVRAVLSTGYGLDRRVQEVLKEGLVGFVQKPYKVSELAQVVAGALAAP